MAKKKSARNTDAAAAPNETETETETATAFVLKVPTHCRCDGCGDKIRSAVKDLTLRCEGILSLDQSALATKGELAVVATADPERLRRRLRKATGKDVGLVFPKPPKNAAKEAAATVQELLARMHLQQQPLAAYPVPAAGAWNALQHGEYAQPAYPWVLQHQQAPPPEPYLASYPAAAGAAYPTASWGAYAAYPHDGQGGGGWLGF